MSYNQTFELASFAHNTPLGAPELRILARNAGLLDALTQHGRPAFCGEVMTTTTYNENALPEEGGTYRAWYGAGLAWPGTVGAACVIRTGGALGGSEQVRITYGTAVTTTALLSGTQTYTASLPADAASQVLLPVTVAILNAVPTGRYSVLDGWTGDVQAGAADAWPGLPAFGDVTQARLNQLMAAQSWLMTRLARRADPVFVAVANLAMRAVGAEGGTEWDIWRGSVSRTSTATRLRGSLWLAAGSGNCQEYIRLYVGDALAQSWGPVASFTTQAAPIDVDLSAQSLGATIPVRITRYVPGEVGNTYQASRWTIADLRSETPTLTLYPSGAVSPGGSGQAVTVGTVKAALTQIVATVQACYDRYVLNSDQWLRVRWARHGYGASDEQRVEYGDSFLPQIRARRGDVLYARGAGVTAGWGAVATTRPPQSEPERRDSAYSLSFAHSQGLELGEQTPMQIHYLDRFEGYYPGFRLSLQGNGYIGAFEALRRTS